MEFLRNEIGEFSFSDSVDSTVLLVGVVGVLLVILFAEKRKNYSLLRRVETLSKDIESLNLELVHLKTKYLSPLNENSDALPPLQTTTSSSVPRNPVDEQQLRRNQQLRQLIQLAALKQEKSKEKETMSVPHVPSDKQSDLHSKTTVESTNDQKEYSKANSDPINTEGSSYDKVRINNDEKESDAYDNLKGNIDIVSVGTSKGKLIESQEDVNKEVLADKDVYREMDESNDILELVNIKCREDSIEIKKAKEEPVNSSIDSHIDNSPQLQLKQQLLQPSVAVKEPSSVQNSQQQKQQQQQQPVKSQQQRIANGKRIAFVERNFIVSSSTEQKVIATKHFFNEYYSNLFHYMEQRAERLSEMRSQSRQGAKKQLEKAHFQEETNRLRKRRCRVRAYHFQIVTKIGKGGFGDVFLCRHNKTGEVYAMKRIKRAFMEAKNKTSHVQVERDVLVDTIQSPWLVHLSFSFQDMEYLYLIMEYVAGGDLRGLLMSNPRFTENQARLYVAEMLIAVTDLHKLGFIHRDLKPENFLITKEGHLKLADFGLSKKGLLDSTVKLSDGKSMKGNAKLRSMVGSPNYMAIDLLQGSSYDFTIDFWSIGVMIFELIIGGLPFDGDNPMEIFDKILDYKSVLAVAYDTFTLEELSKDARNLISSLLCQPSERLGKNGLIDFQKHPFFKDFDWENIRRMTPPFVPKLSSETDCSYFEMPPDVDFTPTEVTDINEYSNLLKNAPPLKNFTYNNFELPAGNAEKVKK